RATSRPAMTTASIPSSLPRGLQLAGRGLRLALASAEVRRAYLRLAAVLVVLAVALTVALGGLLWWLGPVAGGMSWGSWIGRWALRIGGSLLAIVVAHLLSLISAGTYFPLRSGTVFNS